MMRCIPIADWGLRNAEKILENPKSAFPACGRQANSEICLSEVVQPLPIFRVLPLDDIEEAGLKSFGHRTWFSIADDSIVDLSNRCQLCCRPCEKGLLSCIEFIPCKFFLNQSNLFGPGYL